MSNPGPPATSALINIHAPETAGATGCRGSLSGRYVALCLDEGVPDPPSPVPPLLGRSSRWVFSKNFVRRRVYASEGTRSHDVVQTSSYAAGRRRGRFARDGYSLFRNAQSLAIHGRAHCSFSLPYLHSRSSAPLSVFFFFFLFLGLIWIFPNVQFLRLVRKSRYQSF